MEIISLLGILGICSAEDMLRKQLHIITIAAFGILGVIFHLYYRTHSTTDMLGGMAVGGILYLVSLLSNERIGKGDAFLLTTTGIYLGFWDNIAILWMGSLLAGIIGIVLYIIFQKKPSYRIPFVPFLLAAYLLLLCFQGTQ
jgi:leader peptidase (prepilin peptidase)/N-methyltransferase